MSNKNYGLILIISFLLCGISLSGVLAINDAEVAYSFDVDSRDISGNNLNGTASGGYSYNTSVFKVGNGSLTLNGTGKIDIPLNMDGNAFSISTWVYLTNKTHSNGILTTVASSSNRDGFILAYDTGDDEFRAITFSSNSAQCLLQFDDGGSVTANTWYHIAFTVNETGADHDCRAYLNGVFKINETDSKFLIHDMQPDIGYYYGSGFEANRFEGNIDQLMIYGDVLTPSEITSLYNDTLNPYADENLSLNISSPENRNYSWNYSLNLNGTTNLNANITYSLDGGNNISIINNSASFNINIGNLSQGLHNITVYAINSNDENETVNSTVYFNFSAKPNYYNVWLYSDMQPYNPFHWDYWNNTVQDFTNIDFDLAFSTGDMVNYGTTNNITEFERIVTYMYPFNTSHPQSDFFSLPGNHDYSCTPSMNITDYKNTLHKNNFFSNPLDNYLNFTVTMGNNVFIILPTNDVDIGCAVDGRYGNYTDYVDWFNQTVLNIQDKNIFVITHFPIYNTTADSLQSSPYYKYAQQSNDFISILQNNNVTAWISAHTHEQISINPIVDKYGTWHISSPHIILNSETKSLRFTENSNIATVRGRNSSNNSWLTGYDDNFTLDYPFEIGSLIYPTDGNISVDLNEYYYLDSNGTRINNFNDTSLQAIEKMVLNYSINQKNLNFSSWYFNFTADGLDGCARGNKQNDYCYHIDNATYKWINFVPNTSTSTFNAQEGYNVQGDGIIYELTDVNSTHKNLILTIDEHYNPNIIKTYGALYNFSNMSWQDETQYRLTGDNYIHITSLPENIPFSVLPDRFKADIRVNYTTGLNEPTQPLELYTCYGYTTGDPATIENCALLCSKSISEFQDDGTKVRCTGDAGYLASLGGLPNSIILKTLENNPNRYYYIKSYQHTAPAYVPRWTYSNDGGATYNSVTNGYETEFNVNYFNDGADPTRLITSLFFNVTSGLSTYSEDTFTHTVDPTKNYAPICSLSGITDGEEITTPKNFIYNIVEYNNDSVNVTLELYVDGFYNDTLVNRSNITSGTYTYIINSTVPNGNYTALLNVYEVNTTESYNTNCSISFSIVNEIPINYIENKITFDGESTSYIILLFLGLTCIILGIYIELQPFKGTSEEKIKRLVYTGLLLTFGTFLFAKVDIPVINEMQSMFITFLVILLTALLIRGFTTATSEL